MSVLQLKADNFHQTVASSACLVIEFRPELGPSPALSESSMRHAACAFGQVDSGREPELAAMFGLSDAPALLIFRERVALYLQGGEHSAERIGELLERLLALDMNAVRAELEESKRAEVALGMRRVCPTARRSR